MVEAALLFGSLFLYMYIFFSVNQVQSIFMVIVEDSFIEVQYKKSYEWLRSGEGDASQGGDDDSPDKGGGGKDGGKDTEKLALPIQTIVVPTFILSETDP